MTGRATGLVSVAVALAAFAFATPARAHELRPVYVELVARPDGTFEVAIKVPARDGQALDVALALPDDCRDVETRAVRRTPDARIERRVVRCRSTLSGREIALDGLDRTTTDALVRIDTPRRVSTTVVRPEHPRFVVPSAGEGNVFAEYARLGVEHIASGYDHLLFLACLLLLAWRADGSASFRAKLGRIAVAVTAFTLAHSVTLALSALDVARLPSASVEAAIALSIVVAAREVAAGGRTVDPEPVRRVWLVAFGFGLLHGFGFAGALRETGLPRGALAEALFSFNVGVEIGQLAFVVVGLALLTMAARVVRARSLERVVGYGAGLVGAYLVVARLALIVAG